MSPGGSLPNRHWRRALVAFGGFADEDELLALARQALDWDLRRIQREMAAHRRRTIAVGIVVASLTRHHVHTPWLVAAPRKSREVERQLLLMHTAVADRAAVEQLLVSARRIIPLGRASELVDLLAEKPPWPRDAQRWRRERAVLLAIAEREADRSIVPVDQLAPSLRRASDDVAVRLDEVIERLAARPVVRRHEIQVVLERVETPVAALCRAVGGRHLGMLAAASPFAVALAAWCAYPRTKRVSPSTLRTFLRMTHRLTDALGLPRGNGLSARVEDLAILVSRKALDTVAQSCADDVVERLEEFTTRQRRAVVTGSVYAGFSTLDAALQEAQRRFGLFAEGRLERTTAFVRGEWCRTLPDDVVVDTETFARQIATLVEVCATDDDVALVLAAVATVARPGEAGPWRREVSGHWDGSLILHLPSGLAKTGATDTIVPSALVDALGLYRGMFPEHDGVHDRAQADQVAHRLAELVRTANATLASRGLSPMPNALGVGYSLRRRLALIPGATLEGADAGVVVTEILTHSIDGPNADPAYDKITEAHFATLLASAVAELDRRCTLAIAPSRHPLPRRSAIADITHTTLPAAVWPIAALVCAEQGLRGLWYLATLVYRTWSDCTRVELVEHNGRQCVQVPGSVNAFPLPDRVLTEVAAFIERRRVDERLCHPDALGRVVRDELTRRLLARCADHGIAVDGWLLSATTLSGVGADIADSVARTPAERRALLGVTAAPVSVHTPHSRRVTALVDAAMATFAATLRDALAANPVARQRLDRLRRVTDASD